MVWVGIGMCLLGLGTILFTSARRTDDTFTGIIVGLVFFTIGAMCFIPWSD